jgi:hypothetical protein
MSRVEQNGPPQKLSIWLTVIAPLIMGGLTMPFIPNLAFWLFRGKIPERVLNDAWNHFYIYIMMVRWCGLVLLVAGAWIAIRHIRASNSGTSAE